MTQKTTTITTLTPLRGVAALMVAIYHFDVVIANFVNQKFTMLIDKSYLMVDLFFIMSGFIMLYVYSLKFATTVTKTNFIKFIGARFARIYPLHFFTLLFWVAIFYGLHQPESPINKTSAIPTNLLLLHSFGIHNTLTWNVPSWSISAEWWAYMIFPFLVLFLNKYKRYGIITLSTISIILYFSILYFLPRDIPTVSTLPAPCDLNVTYDYGCIRGIAGFIAGMLTCIAFQQKVAVQFFNRDFISILLILTTILLFHFGVNDLLIVVCFIPLVLTIVTNEKRVFRLLQFKPLQYLGNISYSIYLTHGFAMFYLAVPLLSKLGYVFRGPGSLQISFYTGLWTCGIYLVGVILISSFTYYLVEKPCRNWLNKKFNT